jgi:hypothetical protein
VTKKISEMPPTAKEPFPGHGGSLNFFDEGAALYIPRTVLIGWEKVRIVWDKEKKRITISEVGVE